MEGSLKMTASVLSGYSGMANSMERQRLKLKKRHNKIKAHIKHGIATQDELEELMRIRRVLGYKGDTI